MIGKLGRLIKSKKHPTATLVRRYRLNIAAAHASRLDLVDRDEGELSHPLLHPAALNSFADPNFVQWPTIEGKPWNHKVDPKENNQENARSRVLTPILGLVETERYENLSTIFKLTHIKKARVQVGSTTYSCKEREEGKMTEKTRESYFWIHAKDVPAMVLDYGSTPEWQPNGILYGRILRFMQLDVEAWRPAKPYMLAEVTLFREQIELDLPRCEFHEALRAACT
jgi:hypothetical protein